MIGLAVLAASLSSLMAGGSAAADAAMERFDLRSSRTGQTYRVFLLRPADPPPPGGFPVLYLLDGNATLPMAQQERKEERMAPFRSAAIVGIGYPVEGRFDVARRYHDLTPATPAELLPPTRDGQAPSTGGQDDFLAFLEQDLIPAVEGRIPVDRSRRTLFGHSLAGLFTLHVLFTRSDLFDSYVAADPSIWWKNQAILEELDVFVARARREGGGSKAVLIETAGARAQKLDLADEAAARLARLRSGKTGREVAAALAGLPGLRVAARDFPDETHGSILPLTVADALPFAFGQAPAVSRQGEP